MKNNISIIAIAISSLLVISSAESTQLNLNSFIPAPSGQFQNLEASEGSFDSIILTPTNIENAPCNPVGRIYLYDNGQLQLKYCQTDGTTTDVPAGGWTRNPLTEEIFLTNTGDEVGIGTPSPSAKLHVTGGAFLLDGAIGSTPVSGAGSRMMWIPTKSAIRAGTVSAGPWSLAWDDTYIGLNSAAFGDSNVAYGKASLALGNSNAALADNSIISGEDNIIGNLYAFMAENTDTYGVSTSVFGGGHRAEGNYSFMAGGTANTLYADNSFIAGGNNNSIQITTAGSAIIGGYGNTISGAGAGLTATPNYALGFNNTVGGRGNFAFGANCTMNATGSFCFGMTGAGATVNQDNTAVFPGTKVVIYGDQTNSNEVLNVNGNVVVTGELTSNYRFVPTAGNNINISHVLVNQVGTSVVKKGTPSLTATDGPVIVSSFTPPNTYTLTHTYFATNFKSTPVVNITVESAGPCYATISSVTTTQTVYKTWCNGVTPTAATAHVTISGVL